MAENFEKFVIGMTINQQRFATNLESIIAKYDRPFKDDDIVNLKNLTISVDRGNLRSSKFSSQHFGHSHLAAGVRKFDEYGISDSAIGSSFFTAQDTDALSERDGSVLDAPSTVQDYRTNTTLIPDGVRRCLETTFLVGEADLDVSDAETLSSSDSDDEDDLTQPTHSTEEKLYDDATADDISVTSWKSGAAVARGDNSKLDDLDADYSPLELQEFLSDDKESVDCAGKTEEQDVGFTVNLDSDAVSEIREPLHNESGEKCEDSNDVKNLIENEKKHYSDINQNSGDEDIICIGSHSASEDLELEGSDISDTYSLGESSESQVKSPRSLSDHGSGCQSDSENREGIRGDRVSEDSAEETSTAVSSRVLQLDGPPTPLHRTHKTSTLLNTTYVVPKHYMPKTDQTAKNLNPQPFQTTGRSSLQAKLKFITEKAKLSKCSLSKEETETIHDSDQTKNENYGQNEAVTPKKPVAYSKVKREESVQHVMTTKDRLTHCVKVTPRQYPEIHCKASQKEASPVRTFPQKKFVSPCTRYTNDQLKNLFMFPSPNVKSPYNIPSSHLFTPSPARDKVVKVGITKPMKTPDSKSIQTLIDKINLDSGKTSCKKRKYEHEESRDSLLNPQPKSRKKIILYDEIDPPNLHIPKQICTRDKIGVKEGYQMSRIIGAPLGITGISSGKTGAPSGITGASHGVTGAPSYQYAEESDSACMADSEESTSDEQNIAQLYRTKTKRSTQALVCKPTEITETSGIDEAKLNQKKAKDTANIASPQTCRKPVKTMHTVNNPSSKIPSKPIKTALTVNVPSSKISFKPVKTAHAVNIPSSKISSKPNKTAHAVNIPFAKISSKPIKRVTPDTSTSQSAAKTMNDHIKSSTTKKNTPKVSSGITPQNKENKGLPRQNSLTPTTLMEKMNLQTPANKRSSQKKFKENKLSGKEQRLSNEFIVLDESEFPDLVVEFENTFKQSKSPLLSLEGLDNSPGGKRKHHVKDLYKVKDENKRREDRKLSSQMENVKLNANQNLAKFKVAENDERVSPRNPEKKISKAPKVGTGMSRVTSTPSKWNNTFLSLDVSCIPVRPEGTKAKADKNIDRNKSSESIESGNSVVCGEVSEHSGPPDETRSFKSGSVSEEFVIAAEEPRKIFGSASKSKLLKTSNVKSIKSFKGQTMGKSPIPDKSLSQSVIKQHLSISLKDKMERVSQWLNSSVLPSGVSRGKLDREKKVNIKDDDLEIYNLSSSSESIQDTPYKFTPEFELDSPSQGGTNKTNTTISPPVQTRRQEKEIPLLKRQQARSQRITGKLKTVKPSSENRRGQSIWDESSGSEQDTDDFFLPAGDVSGLTNLPGGSGEHSKLSRTSGTMRVSELRSSRDAGRPQSKVRALQSQTSLNRSLCSGPGQCTKAVCFQCAAIE